MKTKTLTTLIMLATALSFADTITQEMTFGGTPNYQSVMTFEQFDDNGGAYTLESVTVTVSLDTLAGSVLRIDNESGEAAEGSVTLGSSGGLSSTDVALIQAGFQTFYGNVSSTSSKYMTLGADDGDSVDSVEMDGDDYDSLTSDLVSDSASATLLSAVYDQYTGTGTYELIMDVTQFTDFSSLGGVSYSGTPVTTAGSVTVTYNYSIPEPASATLMLGIGLAALWLRRFNV